MQRSVLMLAILILLTFACSLPFGAPQGKDSPNEQAPAAESEKRCGDGVCDGPENAETCADDCVSSPGTRPDEASESAPDEAPAEDEILGQVYVEVEIQRQDGEGTCGSPPWGVDHIDGGDFTCPPPKYWYGYDLVATALQIVHITPAGGSTWRITGDKPGGGTYQKAEHWSDGQRVCAPESIEGKIFDFEVQGANLSGQMVSM